MNTRRVAIVLYGPPATGKSTLAEVLRHRLVQASRTISLDDGWLHGQWRKTGGAGRYADIRQATEPILLLEIGCGEPPPLDFPGATRAANEWIDVLRESGREDFFFLLTLDWTDAAERIDRRFTGQEAKLFLVWQHLGLHALYAHKHAMVTFVSNLGVQEHALDTSKLTSEMAADEVLRIAGL
jgi:hypothetical protein